ncbi:MAG TPA: hypothetical protein V6D05_06110 [Stenomitos sp.]
MNDTERLEHQAELFGSLFLLTQHLARRADAAMEPLGLTTKQWLLLAILVKRFAGQTPTLTEAALWYGSSRQNVKQIALQLESRGFLRLVTDPKDKRVLRLQLTEHVRLLETPQEHQRQVDLLTGLFAALSDPDLARFLELVRRELAAIAPQGLA